VTTIRLRPHGPYVIEGDDVRVIDWEGREYPIDRRPVALCRCGASARKPFCDGSHRTCGFDGGAPAPVTPDADPNPAPG
jgi:CDGSH-type Zn-finger protein